MIAWSTLYPAVLALFGRLASNDPAYVAEDRDRPRKAMADRQNTDTVTRRMALAVRVLSAKKVGEDERRYEHIPAGTTGEDAAYADHLKVTVTGQRVIRFQLECDALENTDTSWAMTALSRVQTRLEWLSSHDALHAVECSLNRVGEVVQANFRHEGRMHSRALLEVWINAVVNDVDPVPLQWIQHVTITGHLQDVNGEELPSPPNWTAHVL